ncbi:MAG: aspartate carbamoyltransferase catalytic subunit [Actinobacteria bacterium]|uniref:aspartate carbamoyltransferase n=1 Tax=freshwater metagenome TaxID=449393 RepID=A0A6J7PM31_9ZZZZ|nr:aspartate carbamoyltransferase catalytic subunit [Actinomycetota bacterium]
MKHLLSTHDLSIDEIVQLLELADHMAEINSRAVPKVPALRGKTIASVFFEDSTRTRLSFETAAKRLSAEVMTFSASTSSVNKGESLRDTIETLTAMGVHAFVVRHKSSGVPKQITQWTNAAVVNAGDGWHQHPTQAMLDAYTITRNFGDKESMAGRTIAIVGDIKHSRVARSNVDVFTRMGANVVLVAPDALLPSSIEGWNVSTASSIDEVVGHVDVLYMLRMQRERMDESLVISLKEYTDLYALTEERAARLAPHALLMHPGPINRGVEMQVDPSEVPGSRILQQVANGISVRMAVLFSLLGGEISPAATLGGEA